MANKLNNIDYTLIDFADPISLLEHGKKLEGHTFQDVLDAGISPEGNANLDDYSSKAFKGGLGNLIEERWYGYKTNSDSQADFPEAGVELKTTCYDTKTDGSIRAGERLVLSMIQYDESIEAPLEDSHVWEKCKTLLLVFYGRDKELPKYEQTIDYVALFTPPEADLAIIEDDYQTIQKYITEGRADELSESLTRYLGACTKGANAEKGNREQVTYAPGKLARSRAWCLKNSYMNSVLHNYILGDEGGDSIVKDPSQLKEQSFEELVLSLIEPYIGRSDSELCEEFGIVKSSKSKWARLTSRMLGIKSDRAEEFEKAGVQTKTIRIGDAGSIAEDISFPTFKFKELVEENWEDAQLHKLFEETRFLFIAFKKEGDNYILKGARFWSMPVKDIEGPLHDCWQATVNCAKEGVELVPKNGRIASNLPGKSNNPVAHVRPHASAAAYKLGDGTVIGDIDRNADQLPDGRWMTKQCFWLNKGYVYEFIKDFI